MKKKIYSLIGALVLGFGLYIGFQIYQTSKLELISNEAIQTFELSEQELTNDTVITVEAAVERFEALELTEMIVIEDTLYLMIYKWPAFQQVNQMAFDLEYAQNIEDVNKISLIYGDIYSDEGSARGYSHIDLVDHPDQEVIWKKGDFHD